MLASGFVTGDSGMGHVAITSTRPTQLRGYFSTVFDARLTDHIEETISGVKLKIRFLRVKGATGRARRAGGPRPGSAAPRTGAGTRG
jgi:hypothetical protein